jgi:hypothetical protein
MINNRTIFGQEANDQRTLLKAKQYSQGFEPLIIGGVAGQYFDGTKEWVALNQAAVDGLKTSDTPTFAGLVLTGNATAGQFRLSDLNTAPANASDTGTLGEIRITADYIFICVTTNTWKRAAIATW